MSDSELLLKAAINRISARITEKLINSAKEFSLVAEDIPQKLQDEWSRFKDEVIEESERLEKITNASKEKNPREQLSKKNLVQIQINNLRSKVIEINKDIEVRN